MAQVSPLPSNGNGNGKGKVIVPSRRKSFLGVPSKKLMPIRLTSLNLEKFDALLSPDFTSGFEESEDCFTEITTKAASLLGAEKCFIYIKDPKEQKLYTFIKDYENNQVRATKPIDRGITGSILSEPSGYSESKIGQCDRWLEELDELPDNFVTYCYLAWPIIDFATAKSIGVVEFRNRINGSSFNAADLQFARIIALQLGHAIIHYKQEELLAGHTEVFHKAYEKGVGEGETIDIPSFSEESSQLFRSASGRSGGKYSSRGAFALTKQPSVFTVRRSSVGDRDWDYDVFLKSESTRDRDVFRQRARAIELGIRHLYKIKPNL